MADSILGIALTDSTLSLAQVEKGRCTGTASAALSREALSDLPALAAQVRQLCRANRLRVRQTVLVLPSRWVATRQLKWPRSAEASLNQALPFEFRDFFDREEISWAYQIQRRDDRQLEIFAVAAKSQDIDRLRRGFSHAGLDLIAVLPREAAWSNLLRSDSAKAAAIYDPDTAALSLFSQGSFRMSKALDLRGDPAAQIRQTLNFYTLSTGETVEILYSPDAGMAVPGVAALPLPGTLPEGAALAPDTLNLAPKPPLLRPRMTLPLIAAVSIILLLFTKFGILGPLEAKTAAYEALSRQQLLLEQTSQRLTGYSALEQAYLRLSDAGMTQSERTLAEPTEVLALVRETVLPAARLDMLTLSGNVLTLELGDITLDALGELVSQLEASPLVVRADMHSAEGGSGQEARILLRLTLQREAGHE